MTPRKQDRAEFEAWARTFATWDVERDDDKALGTTGYTDVTLAIAWAAWQAGRCPQTVPLGGKLVPVAVTGAEFSQFLSDVMTAAGLVENGMQCKALGERLGEMVMRLRVEPLLKADHFRGATEMIGNEEAPVRKPLTDRQIQEIWCSARNEGNQTGPFWFAHAIERAHGIT